jgi:hypothetical protein
MNTDALGRTPIGDAVKRQITEAFTIIPEHKRSALLVRADLDGNAVAQVAARFGDTWKVAAGAGVNLREKRPTGYVAVEAAW